MYVYFYCLLKKKSTHSCFFFRLSLVLLLRKNPIMIKNTLTISTMEALGKRLLMSTRYVYSCPKMHCHLNIDYFNFSCSMVLTTMDLNMMKPDQKETGGQKQQKSNTKRKLNALLINTQKLSLLTKMAKSFILMAL